MFTQDERTLRVLGLESSCDDTAAAVVTGRVEGGVVRSGGEMLSRVTFDQDSLHAAYGGVVPEIAARAHVEQADVVIGRALAEANCELRELDAIAVTAGPGLVPGLLAGVMTARGVAAGGGLPLLAINHLAAHALTVRLTDQVQFPYLALLASGGHCLFVAVEGPCRYHVYGSTRDDAPGEAFDKVARLLGLGLPGGPALERLAADGVESQISLPRPLLGLPGCDMSFSGLKTAVRRVANAESGQPKPTQADIAAAFQAAVRDVLVDRTENAMQMFRADHPECRTPTLAAAGGVMANQTIRAAVASTATAANFTPVFPEPALCTDNGAMVAWAGIELLAGGEVHPPDFPVRARWPLTEFSA